jgi:L-aminopeptidase/D-esterase-like protein
VNGAIIWDYGPRQNTIYPDKALGRAATRAAVTGSVPIGQRGAGRSATVGKMKYMPERGGQGAAFREFAGAKILVVTVLNALGALVDRSGTVVRGNLDRATGQRARTIDILAQGERRAESPPVPTENTTLTLVVTDAKLSNRELSQFGRQVHTFMARAIDPFHTSSDGDTLYAVTANRVDATATADTLAMVAGEVAWDAVLSVVES